jgi:PqqD family protein of HPr-rel-A system
MATPIPAERGTGDAVVDVSVLRWRIPRCQRFVFQDYDDGIVMFDALVGSTHVLSVSAAETLALIGDAPGLPAPEIHRLVLERTGAAAEALTYAALVELLWQLENLELVAAELP